MEFYTTKQRPNLSDYNLTKTEELARYISDWNEYTNLLGIVIKELEEENQKLKDDGN